MSSKSLKILVKNIEEILSQMRRNASWLAEESGISKGMISRILNLSTNPTLATLDSIAMALGMDPKELINEAWQVDLIANRIQSLEHLRLKLHLDLVELALKKTTILSQHDQEQDGELPEAYELEQRMLTNRMIIDTTEREVARLKSLLHQESSEKVDSPLILGLHSRLTTLNDLELKAVGTFIDNLTNRTPVVTLEDVGTVKKHVKIKD